MNRAISDINLMQLIGDFSDRISRKNLNSI